MKFCWSAGTTAQIATGRDWPQQLAATRGLSDVLPCGRPGNPDSEDGWFITDWMDTARAQQALNFQHHSWDDMLEEMRNSAGWTRRLMMLIPPIARIYVKRQATYRHSSETYVDPWEAMRTRLGEPSPDHDVHRTAASL